MTSTRLQRELKKKRPFDVPEQEAALGLVRTNDRLQIQFTRLFRKFGLTPSQYNVLRILRGEGGPLPILEIAERTVTVVPGITGLIDRLESAGLVARTLCRRSPCNLRGPHGQGRQNARQNRPTACGAASEANGNPFAHRIGRTYATARQSARRSSGRRALAAPLLSTAFPPPPVFLPKYFICQLIAGV